MRIDMFEYNHNLLSKCGVDVFISGDVEIRRPQLVTVGNHVAIDSGFYCTTKADIGDYIHIAPYATVIGGEKGYFRTDGFNSMAVGARIICGSDEHLGAGLIGPIIPDEYHDKLIIAPVIFEMFSSIGTNVVVLPGVILGVGSVVGACSLVTHSTEPWTIYYGIPARPVKMRPRENMLEFARRLGYDC